MRTNRDDILVHAGAVLRMFDNAVQDIGASQLLENRDYSVTREAWIAAVYLAGLRVITEKPWWLAVNTVENSEEDIIGYTFTQVDEKRTKKEKLPIQVFERTENSPGDVFQSIKRKLEHTDLTDCSLVCYVKRPEFIKLDVLSESLASINPNPRVRDIWLIATRAGDGRKMSIVKLYPDFSGRTLVIDLDAEHQDQTSEKTFLYPFRGVRKGDKFEKTGKSILLKPNFTFEELL